MRKQGTGPSHAALGQTREGKSRMTVALAEWRRGETVAGHQRCAWQRGDTFSVPCWTRFEHAAATDAQLFSMSDVPLMRFSRFYRFEAD